MTEKYTQPSYMDDAPSLATDIAAILAGAAVTAMSSGIKEVYPGLNENSLEFRQLLAAVFHRAEWLSLKGGES